MTTVGVIGGTGWLGGALLRPALAKSFVTPDSLILSSRSGKTFAALEFAILDNKALLAASDFLIV